VTFDKSVKHNIENLAISVFTDLENQKISLVLDDKWPAVMEPVVSQLDLASQQYFWQLVGDEFLKREKGTNSFFHKGNIYWRKATVLLKSGEPIKSIESLEKAVEEDRRTFPGQTKAAAMFLATLKPMFYRYNSKKKDYQLSKEILNYYEILSSEEKEEFADTLFSGHDLLASGQVVQIKPEFFHFIIDDSKREIFSRTYTEVQQALLKHEATLPCMFAIGSIVELMLDDLFERDRERIWKIFRASDASSGVRVGSRLNKTDYDDGMTLGEKIQVLKLMAGVESSPIPRHTIFQLMLIGEYRDLIHPRRQKNLQVEITVLTALTLFSMLANIASHWWPVNVEKRLEETKPVVKETADILYRIIKRIRDWIGR
jgi:hypothetical protein